LQLWHASCQQRETTTIQQFMFNDITKRQTPSSSSSSSAASSGPGNFTDENGNNHLLLAGFKQLLCSSHDGTITDSIVDFFATVGELDVADTAFNARLTEHMCQWCFNLVSEAANAYQ
jgi:hypothetical protein